MLRDWLTSTRRNSGFTGAAEQVVLNTKGKRDPLKLSILSEQALPAETLIIPVRVAWQTSAFTKDETPRIRDLWRKPRRPGIWRARNILRRHPERAHCIAAESATLSNLRERLRIRSGHDHTHIDLSEYIFDQAALSLDVAEHRLRGSRYKVPRDVAKHLQAQPRFRQRLAELSEETGRSVKDLQKEAGGIMKEMISTPNTFWIDAFGMLNKKIRRMGYEDDMVINEDALESIRRITSDHPTVFLFTHKTHVDAFAHTSVMYENDFPVPHTLGGVNMAFGGLGFITRRAGAIFIRRSFKDDPLYKMILRQYIGYLMDKRFPLSWAFEGTRSRVGKLMPPMFGLLKYVIEAAHASDAENLHIVPVAINYDLINDVSDYAKEQAGGSKRPESLSWFVGYLRALRHPMGKIYLDYGKPIVLERAPDPDDRVALAKIAMQVGVEVNQASPLTLPAVVCMCLLGYAPGALTHDELREEFVAVVSWARERGIRIADNLLAASEQQTLQLGDILVDGGLISRYDEGPEILYAIGPDKHSIASYYRNTTVHYFVSKAIAELALLYASSVDGDRLAAFWKDAERLRDLFKFEFFYAPSDEFRDEVREEIGRTDNNWESALQADDTGDYASMLLDKMKPLVAHATLLPYVEAYRIVANTVAMQASGTAMNLKDCVAQSLVNGKQAWLQRRISSEASIGKLFFENGYKILDNKGLIDSDDPNIDDRRRQMSQDLRDLARRMRAIRVLAHPGKF